ARAAVARGRAAAAGAGQIRGGAAAAARRVLAEAAEEAGERLRRTEDDADTIRAGARVDAQTLLDLARTDAARGAQEVMADAEERAKILLAEAEDKVGAVLAEAEERAHALVGMRRAAAEAAYRTALDDAARIVGEAQDQAVQIKTARAALDSELELTRRSALLDLDERLAGRRAEIEAALVVHRKDAEAAEADIEAQFRELGEEHERKRQERSGSLAAELADMRRNAEAEARKEARAIVAGAERERADLVAETSDALARARQREDEAEQRIAAARAAGRRTARWANFSGRLWRGAPWVALAAGVGLAASGEYELARLAGFHELVAPLFPLSVDIYAVVAFKKKSDVRPALSIMAASNLAYHLAERGGVHDEGNPHGELIVLGLTALVVLTFVAIIWRVHRLLDEDHETKPPSVRPAGPPSVRDEPDRTDPPGADRTDDRTDPGRTDRTGPRTDADRTARTAKSRTGPRTDAESIGVLRGLPRTDGCVTVNAARTAIGCNRDRAVRLLDEAGLLSPADRAKHLAAR
ncbi:hypothetical protein ACFXPK_31555, partial [Streptomyces sp. NPDC059142]